MKDKGRKLKGMQALADLLECSLPTVHRLKSSGKIPYYQYNRVIFFYENEVLDALKNRKVTI